MTPKEKALKDTVNKFTNLLDGQVKSGVTVRSIINYYESKLNNEPIEISKSTDGIMENFIEEYIKQFTDENE
jgi:hypothetical protein